MKDLIQALTIFAKYTDEDVINCEHDEFYVCIPYDDVSAEDRLILEELSFYENDNGDFSSTRFGSC